MSILFLSAILTFPSVHRNQLTILGNNAKADFTRKFHLQKDAIYKCTFQETLPSLIIHRIILPENSEGNCFRREMITLLFLPRCYK